MRKLKRAFTSFIVVTKLTLQQSHVCTQSSRLAFSSPVPPRGVLWLCLVQNISLYNCFPPRLSSHTSLEIKLHHFKSYGINRAAVILPKWRTQSPNSNLLSQLRLSPTPPTRPSRPNQATRPLSKSNPRLLSDPNPMQCYRFQTQQLLPISLVLFSSRRLSLPRFVLVMFFLKPCWQSPSRSRKRSPPSCASLRRNLQSVMASHSWNNWFLFSIST